MIDWKCIIMQYMKNVGLWPLYNMSTYIIEKYKSGRQRRWRILQVRGKWVIWNFLHLKVKLSLYKLTEKEENELYRWRKDYSFSSLSLGF